MTNMRRILFKAAVLLMLPLWPVVAAADKIEEVRSPGGITAWLVHEPAVPVISLEFSFEGGGSFDPSGRKGVANMVSGLLDEGAGDMTSLEFQTRLEDKAIRLSFDSGRDTFSGSLKTLREHHVEAFDMLRLALTAPRFDPAPVERIRQQILANVRSAEKDPNSMARRTWFAKAFPNHTYGLPHDGTVDSVSSITADDLRAYINKVFQRKGLKIGVVGDITAAELGPLLDKTFGNLPETSAQFESVRTAPTGLGQLEVVDHNIPQSRVMFGSLGIPRDDPEWYAAYVLNYVVGGGGLTSRLSGEVREKRGLVYSVYSYLYPLEYSALYMGGLGTRNEQVAEALEVVRTELRKVREEGISENELRDAKTYLNGSFPLRLTSSGRIASLLVAIQRHDLGMDYIERRPEMINAVTMDDVSRVAKRLLNPDKLLVVVVGKPQGLKPGG
jgi:zinc protease